MTTCYSLKIEMGRFWMFYWSLELVPAAPAGFWFLGVASSGSQLNLCSERTQLNLEPPCYLDCNFRHLRKITNLAVVEISDLTTLTPYSHLATASCHLLMGDGRGHSGAAQAQLSLLSYFRFASFFKLLTGLL